MRQDQLIRQIEDEARIEAAHLGPDFDELFADHVMNEGEAFALSNGPRNKPKIKAKSCPPARRKAA